MNMKSVCSLIASLVLTGLTTPTLAQEVSIPDPGLNAAVRQALQKPAGPLSEQDMLGLSFLNAHDRNISNLAGLDAARNLNTLLLFSNHLTNFDLPTLTNLTFLNLSGNSLTNVSLPGGMTNLFSLLIAGNPLTQLTLPADLTRLEELGLEDSQLTSFNLPASLTGLGVLDVGFNALTNLSLPDGLTNLNMLRLSGNAFTNVNVPTGLIRLTQLYLDQNQLTNFTLPTGMTNLHVLDLSFNQLTNIELPSDLQNLIELDIENNQLTNPNLPSNLTGLSFLRLRSNQLTSFSLPADLRALSFLDLGENQLHSVNLPAGLGRLNLLRLSGNTNLSSLTLRAGMTNLTGIFLRFDGLTNLTLPSDLNQLVQLDVLGNQLTHLSLPAGLTNLATLVLSGNQLMNLTLPSDMIHLVTLVLNGNPLAQLLLSEPEAFNLAGAIASLQDQGVQVLTFPVSVQLSIPEQRSTEAFAVGINGPPGVYSVFSSSNLTDWTALDFVTNPLGRVVFTDVDAHLFPQKFYRALRVVPPTNMVFIAPNIFTLGSPDDEVGHQPDESPLTDVSLTHGFWMSKYLVTQQDYLAVTGENPSQFPGDLDRPVESVSWFAASNYCVLLTVQDRAAGRIPPGSHYRLPTEAEWECAARAGTSTRFSYGDDPNYTELKNHAWYFANSGLMTQPVGQKLPNAWGLYDMAGNVWEWCQDWYGPYPGGFVTDPHGPASNPQGVKVIRGGAWDASEPDCRSGRRLTKGVHPLITDSILGFRVVLVSEP